MSSEPPASVRDALTSGDPDRANQVIDLVDGLSVDERADTFDAYLDGARAAYDSDDGYVRQSTVRFAEALHPRLALRAVGRLDHPEPVPAEYTLEDAARYRRELRTLFLEALVDTDGRIRRAAVRGLKSVAITADVVDNRTELESLLADLESLAAEADEDTSPHIEGAVDQLTFYLDRSPFSLPDDGF